MMPISERIDSGFLVSIVYSAGYLVGSLLSFVIVLFFGWSGEDSAEDFFFVTVVVSLFVVAFGVVNFMGAFLSTLVFPTVGVKRVYWYGLLLAGGFSAIALWVAMHTWFYAFEPLPFVLLFVFAGVSMLGMRILGLTFGWSRPWYPPGACETCGYDLRKTPIGGNCPECGTAAEKPLVRMDSK